MCKLIIRKYSVAFIWSLTFFLVVDGVCVCGTNSQPHIVCCRNRIIETRRLLRGSGYWFYENHVVKSTSRFSLEEEEEGEKKQKLGFAAEDLSCQKRP